jgi:hypothetical protein
MLKLSYLINVKKPIKIPKKNKKKKQILKIKNKKKKLKKTLKKKNF